MLKATFDAAALRDFGIEGEDKMMRVARRATSAAAALIQERTPIDTGFARASWFPMINGQPAGPGGVVAEFAFAGASLGDRIGAGNNADYIGKLEYGHSQQAPQGMVGVTVAQWDQIVAEAAAAIAAAP